MVPILLAVSGLISAALAALYVSSRIRFARQLRREQEQTAKLAKELETLQQKATLSFQDPVTKVLGWQLFEDRVNQGIKESARYKFILGVLYVDIDHFKLINSALGYEAGNLVLQETADRLQSCVRQVDTITRQGKDTFVVMLAQLAKQETAAIIIQRMLQTIAQPFIINGNPLSVTVSIGAAFYPADGLTVGDLMHHAEYAMLVAKSRGKGHYQFYQESAQADSQRELSLYNSLSSDTFLDELHLLYQPVMNAVDRSLYGVDAQIIWRNAGFGEISAEELFVLADRQRKLNKITERMLKEACQKFQHWRALGLKPQMLAVPVRLKQLENTQFIYRLSQILQEQKMQPAWLILEIRESTAPVSLDILEKSFNMLNYLGVKIAIDHFGSGGFSLRHIKLLNVHYLKLDPAIINEVALNEQTKALIKAVVAFASTLSLQVMAAGVESAEQASVLQDLGVQLMQGRFLSAPLSEAEMADKMTHV